VAQHPYQISSKSVQRFSILIMRPEGRTDTRNPWCVLHTHTSRKECVLKRSVRKDLHAFLRAGLCARGIPRLFWLTFLLRESLASRVGDSPIWRHFPGARRPAHTNPPASDDAGDPDAIRRRQILAKPQECLCCARASQRFSGAVADVQHSVPEIHCGIQTWV
jgi:hypothetical protein